MPVKFDDILEAFLFADAGDMGGNEAFLCRRSGKIYLRSDVSGMDELPDDVDDDEKYVQIPDRWELDLGKPLVLDFASQCLPDDFDDVRQFFTRKGAYAKFKTLLERRGARDRWFDFEAKAVERALREWCDLESIELQD